MMNENVLFYKKKFNTDAKTLFKAFTDPNQLIHWWGPKNTKLLEVNLNLCINCKFSFKMKGANNQVFYINGYFKEISEPSKLVYTFNYEGLKNIPPESEVTIRFEEHNAQTEIILKQVFKSLPQDYDRRLESWKLMFENLMKLLATSS